LRGQLDGFLLSDFAKPEISYFDDALVEEDVLRLEVVVNDLVGELMQVADSTDYLPYYQFGLFLGYLLVLLQVERQVRTLAKLQHSAERIGIYLDCVIKSHDVGMAQHLVHTVLSYSMFHVVVLCLCVPFGVEFVYLHCNFLQFLSVVAFVDLTEASTAK